MGVPLPIVWNAHPRVFDGVRGLCVEERPQNLMENGANGRPSDDTLNPVALAVS